MRKATRTPEEAEKMLRQTGRLVRPLRLSDVKLGQQPKKMTIVANAKERRTAADTLHIYHVSKLQARIMAYREVHPVWGHERVLIFGKLQSDFMQPDVFSSDPIETTKRIAFKTAFREDDDIFFLPKTRQFEKELEGRGLMNNIQEGTKLEEKLKKKGDPSVDIPDNFLWEAILDNVVDVGEIVFQFWAAYLNPQPTTPETKNTRLQRRLNKRMSQEMGTKVEHEFEDKISDISKMWDAKDSASHYQGGMKDMEKNLIHNAFKVPKGTSKVTTPNW